MDLIDFASWDPGALAAYAIVATMALIVLALVFIFRELGAKPEVTQKASNGSFGFQRSRGEKVRMEVMQIRQLSADVKNFRLRPLDEYVDYFPGQFLTFHLGEEEKVPRCYSLNSSPTRPGLYEVAVKRLEGGIGSGWMHDRVAVGDCLSVSNPSGRFHLRQDADATVLVAGGIGITPMLAILTYLVDAGAKRPVYFFYCARSEADLVFRSELEDLASRSPQVQFIPVLSRAEESWTGLRGRLSAEIMQAIGIDFATAELYTCGPSPLMDLAKTIATVGGMPESRFHNEIFASPASVELEPRKATIQVEDQTLAYDGNASLLEFLNDNDVVIPYSCQAGVCGTCEITVTDGDIESLPSEYLSEDDRKSGRCLSCISFPKSDLKIER
ncbi:MAG: ferredoxin-NADP reductase [Rhodothermales bacterium]|jgi:ferredoxin-NADP reductase